MARVQPRFLTYRVQNIPEGISKEGLKDYFYVEDRDDIKVKSFCPAVDTPEGEEGDYTATILFRPHDDPLREPRIAIDVVDIDRAFIGFTPLYVPPRERGPIAVDIIAICGLAGHAFGSWAHAPEHMWIRDYLPRDAPNARILTYGYPATLQGNTSISTLQDYTTNFVQNLIGMRDSGECESRPIIFIGHSLGCLIIKKALADFALMGVNPSRLPVRTIIFLGAPHRGLNVTAMQTLVKGKATQALIDELAVRSRTLNEINQRFAHIATDIEILTCYETKPTPTAIEVDGVWVREGDPILMVELDSAQLYFPKESLMSSESDHTQMAKIRKGEGGIYSRIKATVRQGLVTTARIVASVESNPDSLTKTQLFNSKDITPPYSPPQEQKFDLTERPKLVELRSRTLSSSSSPKLELAVSKTLEEKEHNVKFQEAIEKDDKCQEEVTETEKTDDLLQCNICKRTFGYKEPILNCVECCTDDNGHNYRLQSKEGEDSNYDNPYNACENCIPGPKCPKEIGKGTHILLRYPGIRARPRLIRTLLISDPEVVRAVKSADVTALRLCSKNKQALNIRTNGGKTPLHLAVQYGLEEIVTILLEMGAEFDTMDDDKLTPFTTAMLYGYSSIVNTLIQYGVDINGHSSTKDGPYLHTAAMNGDPEILKVILQNKPFLDVVYDDVVALNLAMRHNLEFVKLLLEAGADVNIRKPTADARLLTPIYYAAFRKRKDIVKLLIQYGALLDVDDLEGETPLGLAVRMKALSACRILLEAGANINQGHLKTKCPLLVTACRTREQDDLIQLLLQYKPKIDATTEEGLTALAMAAGLNSVAVCQMLLDAGANIDIVTAAGNSPLMVAVIHGELENTKFLIQRNAKVNVQEKNGYSALSIAAFYGKLDFLQVIVDAGAVSRPPTPCTKWKYFRFHETVSRSTKLRVLEIVRGAKHK